MAAAAIGGGSLGCGVNPPCRFFMVFQLQQHNSRNSSSSKGKGFFESFTQFQYHHHAIHFKKRRTQDFKFSANLGGGGGGEGEGELKNKKNKFITKEQEPQQYWQTAGEREGENPMKTPLPYIIIFGMSTPFVILAVAFANGWIKVPIR